MNGSIGRFSACILIGLSAAVCASQSAFAQVVDIADGSGDPFYSNWSAPGFADADNPHTQSYNNYRKGGVNTPPGPPVVEDNGDGSATWSNVSHGGGSATPCCGNVGMFMGQSPSTRSYPDAELFIRSHIEPGHSAPVVFDSEGRRTFDMRFGFTESPTDWVADKTLTSADHSPEGNFDLWTRNHGSDTVYLNMQFGESNDMFTGDDSGYAFYVGSKTNGASGDPITSGSMTAYGNREPGDENNKYVALTQALKGQSGIDAPSTSSEGDFREERDRSRWIGEGSGSVLQSDNQTLNDPNANFLTVAGPTVVDHDDPAQEYTIVTADNANTRLDTGVGYDGNLPISWNMELNDPGATPGSKEAREVKFNIRAGDIEYSQVFDPGDASNPVVPNPYRDDDDTTFEDGFFDWQNAYPIFYLGPGGGTGETWNGNASSPTGAEQIIGFTGEPMDGNPGDFNMDDVADGIDTLVYQREYPNHDLSELHGPTGAFGTVYAASAAANGVPEPTSVALLVLGTLGVAGLARRRRLA